MSLVARFRANRWFARPRPTEKAKESKSAVLVHCQAGKSRSATVVLAYLVSTGLTLKAALDLVQSKRSQVRVIVAAALLAVEPCAACRGDVYLHGLLHCFAPVRRTDRAARSCACALVLMSFEQVAPNLGFMRQLCEFECSTLGVASASVDLAAYEAVAGKSD